MLPRSHPLTVRMTEEEKLVLQEAAKNLGMSRNAFIRLAALNWVDQLLSQDSLSLSSDSLHEQFSRKLATLRARQS
jgi:uncharacterized protein (DUF1778 family)